MNTIHHVSDADENTIVKFVEEFFSYYDKNRHILHTMFAEKGSFVVLGNHSLGPAAIQQSILSMVSTTHQLISVDVKPIPISVPENTVMFHVLCYGDVEVGNDKQTQPFTAVFLVYYNKPNILHAVSYNERYLWPKLA